MSTMEHASETVDWGQIMEEVQSESRAEKVEASRVEFVFAVTRFKNALEKMQFPMGSRVGIEAHHLAKHLGDVLHRHST